MNTEDPNSPPAPPEQKPTGELDDQGSISPVGDSPAAPLAGTPARTHAALLFILICGTLLAADLWTKSAAFEFLDVSIFTTPSGFPAVTRSPIHVLFPGCALEAALNLGAFNGWFAWAPWLLIGVSALALPLCFFWATFRSSNYLFVIALALISSGAAGNLYDRWVIGGVRDFIRWSVKWGNTEYVWPNFNLADSHIVIGVAIVMVLEWRKPEISEATHP
ncbi:MAG: signal peptidase II [Planctomycetota bacterium]|nr:signal peptidase II [Planctomycetota bacterium]MDG2083666.1 signal peptidase II [Planctomycetota bacterium]